MKQFFGLIILALTFAPALRAQGNHEYSPLQEKTVNYKNWTFKDLKDNKPVELRSLVRGKKLVMVVYFAPWCPNWKNEAPVAARLYEKYKAQGLEVIGVGEYGSRDDVLAYFGPAGAPYPVVMESEGREAKTTTTHYSYRQLTGDTRNWGSPWNIFLEPAKLKSTGEVLTENAWIVNGELIEADVDKFIGERLGVKTAAVIVPCKD
jgi:thiol-disulfide isomerase/thioredoxin